MKKITKAGEGWRNAEFDSIVTASWKLTLKDSDKALSPALQLQIQKSAVHTQAQIRQKADSTKSGV